MIKYLLNLLPAAGLRPFYAPGQPSKPLLYSIILCMAVIFQYTGTGTLSAQVTAPSVSDDTTDMLFVRGRDRSFQPVGGLGIITPGPPRKATALFRDVPEGRHLIDCVGYATHTFLAPNPSWFPPQGWCVRDFGEASLAVVSDNRREKVTIPTTSASMDCNHIGFNRYIVNSDYTPGSAHPFFGSLSGDNIVEVYLDNWGASARIELNADTGTVPSPFGLFESLPDTGSGETWPEPAAWNSGILTLTADANGDARCYLVVKPKAGPVLWEVAVENRTTTESARILVWISGPATGGPCSGVNCNDGNPCTTDICDSASGCLHTPLPDLTTCGDGLVCHANECVTDLRLQPIGSLTGDCSNDGTATTSFAQMRCGNSVILGDPPLEIERYPALTFDLSSLPAGVAIHSAHVYLYQQTIYGDRPYTDGMAQVVAEHVNYTTLYGGCHTWSPIQDTIGQVLVSDSADLGWRSVDITEAVRYGLQASPRRAQIRLRFVPTMIDGNGLDDMAVFASDNTVTPEWIPFLFINIAPP